MYRPYANTYLCTYTCVCEAMATTFQEVDNKLSIKKAADFASKIKINKEGQHTFHDYLGISESIVNSSYSENEWAAFYESTIEPIALQMGLLKGKRVKNNK